LRRPTRCRSADGVGNKYESVKSASRKNVLCLQIPHDRHDVPPSMVSTPNSTKAKSSWWTVLATPIYGVTRYVP
jgi:hypothetical protein